VVLRNVASAQQNARPDTQNAKIREGKHLFLFQHHRVFLEHEDEADQYFKHPLERERRCWIN